MTINHDAPVVQKKEIHIQASPSHVWNVLTEINNWDKWNDRIMNPALNGSLEAGSTFTWKTGGSKISSKVHTSIPNITLGWVGKALGAAAIHNWYLEKTDQGTKVKVEESMEGWIVKLMKNTINTKLADDMEYWLKQLKTECEKPV